MIKSDISSNVNYVSISFSLLLPSVHDILAGSASVQSKPLVKTSCQSNFKPKRMYILSYISYFLLFKLLNKDLEWTFKLKNQKENLNININMIQSDISSNVNSASVSSSRLLPSIQDIKAGSASVQSKPLLKTKLPKQF